MSSGGKARPNDTVNTLGAAKQATEPRDPKQASMQTASPATGAKASTATADEVLARQALEGLKRIRAKARMDKMAIPTPAPAVVRPAVIVAKPPPPRPPWVVPLASLAVAVGVVVSVCTGVMAYLITMQPAPTNTAANAEIRSLRDTVAQLRKQMSGVTENLDGLRTAVDQSSKATNDRFGRFAENLDRIERVSSSPTVKLDRLAQAQAQAAAPVAPQSQPAAQAMPMLASAAAAADISVTGSVSPPEHAQAPRKVVKGWTVRQAYEGIAILQGPNGVVEAMLGQQVPGLGRIEDIRNENGRLVVLCGSGAIYSARKPAP
ncbi:hypothetical protein [Bradyrhizobium sp. CCBAU 51753]|uniref:hypothetical protein n=1 Tax=Bradyrhizobium sp. CCBAU 51753 TaxID=1325100 RepID=UPI00188D2A90|nr:hypothetical protein [Bradyrhizobium sp. CCBAU 51753]QOZ28769.1 hypothetical protein XH93_38365 [Bradyrhizobium sp. CCBAU 51753]